MTSRRDSSIDARRPRRGFTLIEVVMSLAIVGTLMVGMVSAMMITSRSIRTEDTPLSKASRSTKALDDVVADLNIALAFTERTDKAVTFTVPDRNGDGDCETIRYAWSGTVGDPLTREYNGADPVIVADDVHQFDLSYLVEMASGSSKVVPPSAIESAEVELLSHDDGPGGTMRTSPVNKNSWIGSYVAPTLPTNATSWKVSRVLVRASATGLPTGLVEVEVQTADADGLPTGTVLASRTVSEVTLSDSMLWVDLSFSGVSGLDPDDGLCVVLRYVSGVGDAARIEHEQDSAPATPGLVFMTSTDMGTTWTESASDQLRIYVYGTYTTLGAPKWP